MKTSLLVTAKNRAEFRKFEADNAQALEFVNELRLVAPAKDIGSHAYLANAFKRSALGDVCGIVHADTSFDPIALVDCFQSASRGNVCGIVGAMLGEPGRPPREKIAWGSSMIEERRVSTLDGCTVFFRRDLPIEFDEATFDGWHCAVEDFSLTAAKAGILVVVPAVKASHLGSSTFQTEWQKEYLRYKQKLMDKWAGVPFETT